MRIALLVLVLTGCVAERELAPILPCTSAGTGSGLTAISSADVADVLVVIDGSEDMSAARASLVVALPRFLDGLVRGDLDHDGLRESTPMRSIHVGVLSSTDCSAPDTRTLLRGPETNADGIVALEAGAATTPDDATRAIASTLALAHDGDCGEPRPFETALHGAALFPRDEGGYVRPEGALVVVVVTRRDASSDDAYYAPRLAQMRPDPDMVVLTILAPIDACSNAPDPWDAPNVRDAAARALEQGALIVVAPVCAPDYRATLDRTSLAVSRCVIGAGGCLGGSFDRDAEGRIDVAFEEVLPPIGSGARFTHCDELEPAAIYERVGVEMWGDHGDQLREVCRIHQVAAPDVLGSDEAGWYWDDGSFGPLVTNPERCASTIGLRGSRYVVGAETRLRWDEHFGGVSNVPCAIDADCRSAGLAGYACDVVRHACVRPTCS